MGLIKHFITIFISINFLLNANTAPVVGIMGVDFDELGNLLSFMEQPIQITSQGMRNAYRGKLWGTDTVIFASHEEKAAASSAIVELILQHHVDMVIFIGTAGALDTRLNIGDVVIPQKLIHCDADFRPYAPLFQMPYINKEAVTNDSLCQQAVESANEFLQSEMPTIISQEIRDEMHISSPKIVQDMIATADRFLITENQILDLRKIAPEVSSIDMEGAAAAQTASEYEMPFILIRTVANYVESPLPEENHRVALDYYKFLKKVQWVYTEGIIKRLFSRIKANWTDSMKAKSSFITDSQTEFGILCTLPNEAEALSKLFDGQPEIIVQGTRKYFRGTIAGKSSVLTASGVGKTAAASAATDMILGHKVQKLINVGTASAMDDAQNIGDLVVAENLIQHDMDVRPFRPEFEISTLSITKLPTDPTLRERIIRAAKERFPNLKILFGEIASGDRIIRDQNEKSSLKDKLPKVIALDSEAAPEAEIAYQYGIPLVSIKTIGDSMLDLEHIQTIQEVVLELLTRI